MAKKKATKKRTATKKASAKASGAAGGGGRGAKPQAGSGVIGAEGLELRMVAAGELKDHPENWRVHPGSQVDAFEAVVREVGFVGYVVWNKRTGHVLDGHMRKNAVGPDCLVPVICGDWTEDQERLVLATFNPLGELAGLDVAKGEALLARVASGDAAVQALLEGLDHDIERALARSRRGAAGDEREQDDGGAQGEGDGAGAGKAKEVQEVHRVMIRCEDELDQLTLVQRLKLQGYQDVKACGGV